MKELLKAYYGRAYGSPLTGVVRCEYSQDSYFEIKDRQEQIVCPSGTGVSVLSNPQRRLITIVDFENFIGSWRGNAGTGQRCDFLIYDGTDYVVFNELSCCRLLYVEDQLPEDGNGGLRKGKRSKAFMQIRESIEKLYAVPQIAEYMDRIPNRVGLFSYRTNDAENSIVGNSFRSFGRVKQIFSNIRLEESLPYGFVSEQRIYPDSFEFC